jgi:ankyrin repeat protein
MKARYLIAMLYAEHLSLFGEPGELLDALNEIDHTSDPYKTVYEQTMRRITSDNHPNSKTNLALTILCYTFFAKRPLRIDELSHALAVKAGSTTFDDDRIFDVSEAIVRSCAGLIVLDDTNNTVNMFHKTLHDYLVDHHNKWFPDGGEPLGRTCISYLSLDDFADGPCPEVDSEQNGNSKAFVRYGVRSKVLAQDRTTPLGKRLVTYPFYQYAAEHWHTHIRGTDSETADVVLRFMTDGKKVSASRQVCDFMTPIENTGIQVAARSSLERSLVHCLQRHGSPLHYVNVRDQYGRTLLSYAAQMNSVEAVRLLVNAGADLNMTSEEPGDEGLTPLLYAAHEGHEDTVIALLDSGADVRSKDHAGRTALAHAIYHDFQAVARILLERGCDPNSEDNLQQTPLGGAAWSDFVEIVELLLKRGAQVNYKNDRGDTALFYAARKGHEGTVELLLKHGAQVNYKSDYGETPLLSAAQWGHEGTVELLLKHGAQVNCKNKRGDTPLLLAARCPSSKVMALLIAGGAEETAEVSREYDKALEEQRTREALW